MVQHIMDKTNKWSGKHLYSSLHSISPTSLFTTSLDFSLSFIGQYFFTHGHSISIPVYAIYVRSTGKLSQLGIRIVITEVDLMPDQQQKTLQNILLPTFQYFRLMDRYLNKTFQQRCISSYVCVTVTFHILKKSLFSASFLQCFCLE